MQILPVRNLNTNNNQQTSFKGHWTKGEVWCPLQNRVVTIHTYVVDPKESYNDIINNFKAKSASKDIYREYKGRSSIYNYNGDNYFTDLSKSLVRKKEKFVANAFNHLLEKDYVQAAKEHVEIININRELGIEKAKKIYIESFINIYKSADAAGKALIKKFVSNANPELLKYICKTVK